MATDDHERAVELLKQLGLKTYEAECFAALHSIPSGTARDVSDVADVPRTRVYDATASLAEQGFVEVQHTSPQRFRAIPLDEAVGMLREQYELRVEELHEALQSLESDSGARELGSQEIWALSADDALDGRVLEYVDEAATEAVMFVGDEWCWSDDLATVLQNAHERGVRVHVCGTPEVASLLDDADLDVDVVDAGAGWLRPDGGGSGDVGRVLLVDRERLLASVVEGAGTVGGDRHEHAIVAEGATNGAVLLSRRLFGVAVEELPFPE